MNHEQRKQASDRKTGARFYYTYVLQFDDDETFYVGSTNNPAARFTEHAIGVGAEATSGRLFHVRLVHQFETRKEAEYNEERITRALTRGPENVAAMIDNFERITRMIRPEKTLTQLREEEQKYDSEMRGSFHYTKAMAGFYAPPAACGWVGKTYGTNDWEEFAKEALDQEAGKRLGLDVKHRWGRPLCSRCVDNIPPEILSAERERRTVAGVV